MEQFFSVLSECPLFLGIDRESILSVLNCLRAVEVKVPRGSVIFREDDPVKYVGIVLSGAIQILRTDYDGKRNVIMSVGPGALFGEVHMIAGFTRAPASAAAGQDSTIALLDGKKIFSGCENDCLLHRKIAANLTRSVALKNIALNKKIFFMSRRTTREKLMAFLMDQARQHGGHEFTIPYDRQSLADYLSVERSALSTEIGKLKKAGVIDCKGSWFSVNTRENTGETGRLQGLM